MKYLVLILQRYDLNWDENRFRERRGGGIVEENELLITEEKGRKSRIIETWNTKVRNQWLN